MLTAHAGRVEVVAECGSYSRKPVGYDGHAQAGATDQNAPVELSPGNLLGHGGANVRIVHGGLAVGAEVFYLDVLLPQVPAQVFLELKARVVAAEANFHV